MAWLDAARMPVKPPPTPPEFAPAIKAWNMMAGTVEWSALPILADTLDVRDPERWISQLLTIRDHLAP